MQRMETRLEQYVAQDPEALNSTSPKGGPLARSRFTRRVWQPSTAAAGVHGVTFHGLCHQLVAILVDAGCNLREVSEWAGHKQRRIHADALRRPRRGQLRRGRQAPGRADDSGCRPHHR
jgi:integrase